VLIMRNHRGFTLIELLISLVVLGVVTAALFKLITTTQRVSRAQSERVTLQSNIRAGAIVLPSELRQINAISGGGTAKNDIITTPAPGLTTLQFRASRGFGFVCAVPTSTQLKLYGPPATTWQPYNFSALRAPQGNRDSVFVWTEGPDDKTGTDDLWVGAKITAVSLTAGTCADGSAGYVLTINPAVAGLTSAVVKAPARTFEAMEYGLYANGGEYWLGARSLGASEASMQPVLGPLTSDGVSFNFLDGDGTATTDRGLVKSIQITLKGLTDQAIVVGSNTKTAYVRDSLVTQVVLRNSLR
jgi:prepilin-type N-terminal cleavage/methylation domain-containing protein